MTSKKEKELDYYIQLSKRVKEGEAQLEARMRWLGACYHRMDTDRKWVVPFSLMIMLVFTVFVAIPVCLYILAHGASLNLFARYPRTSMFLGWFGSRVRHWTFAFIGCTVICVVVHACFLYFGLEAYLIALSGR